jgi:hypothetical protein
MKLAPFDHGGSRRQFAVEVVLEGASGHFRPIDDLAQPAAAYPTSANRYIAAPMIF